MIEFHCEICGTLKRKPWSESSPGTPRYCSWNCKAEAQRQQKPVDREWLYQKYIVEGLSAPDIAQLVHRDSKRVWQWLHDFDIPTRPRGSDSRQHFQKGQQSAFTGHVHTDQVRERIRQARLDDGHVPYLQNGQHYLKGKRGAQTTNWKGGITPERQAFYGTLEWKAVAKAVWERDQSTCQRCGKQYDDAHDRGMFDMHHIVDFKVVELRSVLSNIVLLCERCHYWVHSDANINKEFLK